MERLYTERNLLRPEVAKTWDVNLTVYGLLLDCCKKYLDNLAEQFPAYCPDGEGCDICGVDEQKLNAMLLVRIPGLHRGEYSNSNAPVKPHTEGYDQFALFDYIEYISQNMVTVIRGYKHGYFHHYHFTFRYDKSDFRQFQGEINDIFKMSGLQYVLTDKCQIERLTDVDDFVERVVDDAQFVSEKGLKELIIEAATLYHNARPETYHLAAEKIWDAFERMKSFYTELDKKHSADMLIEGMANRQAEFEELLRNEFKTLTVIGNNFRIRHHETNKIDIASGLYYDYLFIRCLSLVSLAVRTVIEYE